MSEVILRSDIKVDLIQSVGSDETVAMAARASTGNDQIGGQKIAGLINYLVREKHFSPLEHVGATFRVEAPIFVAREWMRHRTQSYNELSARYAEMKPEFYIPPSPRPLVNQGSGAHPSIIGGSVWQGTIAEGGHRSAYRRAWQEYYYMLEAGVATEVARNVLPVGIYTTFYATANLRNWLQFLDLRDGEEGHPQWEIVQAAIQVKSFLNEQFPVTMEAWKQNRRAQ